MQIIVLSYMESVMPPNYWQPIFVKKTHIKPVDIRTKFEQFNCSGVLDIQIFVFILYGRYHAHYCQFAYFCSKYLYLNETYLNKNWGLQQLQFFRYTNFCICLIWEVPRPLYLVRPFFSKIFILKLQLLAQNFRYLAVIVFPINPFCYQLTIVGNVVYVGVAPGQFGISIYRKIL